MGDMPTHFADRSDAGRRLAVRLAAMHVQRPVVYTLPRGGVPVGVEIARALNAPLDIILVRKIAAPGAPELALGAVVNGAAPHTVINEDVREATGADDAFIARACRRELAEIARRRARYLPCGARAEAAGATAIIADDGLATGATARAALAEVRRQGAARAILAVPVAPRESLHALAGAADDIVCLHAASTFPGVSAFYDDFHQLSDDETIALLARARDAVS